MAAAVTISEALEDKPCKLLWDDPKLEGKFVLGRSLLPFAKNKGTPAPAYLAHLQRREDGGVGAYYAAHISKYDSEGAYPFVPHLREFRAGCGVSHVSDRPSSAIHRALAGQHPAAGATTLGWTSDGQLLMNVRTLRDLCSAVIRTSPLFVYVFQCLTCLSSARARLPRLGLLRPLCCRAVGQGPARGPPRRGHAAHAEKGPAPPARAPPGALAGHPLDQPPTSPPRRLFVAVSPFVPALYYEATRHFVMSPTLLQSPSVYASTGRHKR
jgi:hypothetical protein